MSAKPLFLTEEQIVSRYRIPTAKVSELVSGLEPVGFYERTDNLLYSRKDFEKELAK